MPKGGGGGGGGVKGKKGKKMSYTETQTTPILSAGARGKNSDDRH